MLIRTNNGGAIPIEFALADPRLAGRLPTQRPGETRESCMERLVREGWTLDVRP